MKILLVGGAKEEKFAKISADLGGLCAAQNMTVQIVTANVYSQDIQAREAAENPDILVTLGNKALATRLPVIDGLALMYPWLGQEQMLNEIARHYGRNPSGADAP